MVPASSTRQRVTVIDMSAAMSGRDEEHGGAYAEAPLLSPGAGPSTSGQALPFAAKELGLGRCKISYGTLFKLSAVVTVIVGAVAVYESISLKQVLASIGYYKAHKAEGVPLFLLLNVVLVVLFVPGAIPQLLAGAVFGLKLSIPLAWVGTTLGQTAAFLLGRYLFRGPLSAYIEQHYPKLAHVEAAVFSDGHPWKLLLLLRIAPVFPDSLLNYSLSVTSVSLLLFTWVSAAALVPYCLLYTYLGSASGNIIDTIRGKGEKTPEERRQQIIITVMSVLFGLAALAYVVVVVRRAFTRVLDRAEAEAAARGAGGGDGGGLELHLESPATRGGQQASQPHEGAASLLLRDEGASGESTGLLARASTPDRVLTGRARGRADDGL